MNSNKTNLDTANLIELSRMIETGFFNLPHEIVSLKRDEVLYHQGDNVEKIWFRFRRYYEMFYLHKQW